MQGLKKFDHGQNAQTPVQSIDIHKPNFFLTFPVLYLGSILAVYYYNKGLTFFLVQEYEKAIVSFDKAIEINPKDPRAYNLKGISLFDSHKPKDAIDAYEEAIKVDPKFIHSYINKANTLDFIGRHGWI